MLRQFPWLLVICLAGLLIAPVAEGQSPTAPIYRVEEDKDAIFSRMSEESGKRVRNVTLSFRVSRIADGVPELGLAKQEIVIEEEDERVAVLEMQAPRADKLTVIFAMDISGSMERNNKIEEARQAALKFLDSLDNRADAGLILFDHEVKEAISPAGDPSLQKEHRQRLRDVINAAKPAGGTAYLDATVKAVSMLRGVKGRRAVIVMTDGVDMNSKAKLDEAIEAAQIGEMPVYTVGIGEKGKNDPVTTVLVLDRSGSMKAKVAGSKLSRMDALKRAANRFVELMRPSAQTTLLPFSSDVGKAEAFSADKDILKLRIAALEPKGGTRLYDATYTGIAEVLYSARSGRKAVVVLTDGVDEDPGSRRNPSDVVAFAREAGTPLFMLGLGDGLDESVMKRMAKDTKGEFFRADTEVDLLRLFEDLSIRLHDDGIDETSLRRLANDTGGKYTHVRDIEKLRFISEKLAEELQSSYRVTYRSNRPQHDGFSRRIKITIVREGVVISEGGKLAESRRGLVVPQMDYKVYLLFLAGLGGLLLLPAVGRRLFPRAAA